MRRAQKDEYYKDRSLLRENDSAFRQHKANKAYIKDFSLKHKVSVEWDMNQESIDDRICVLRIDELAVIIDVEELQRAVRFV